MSTGQSSGKPVAKNLWDFEPCNPLFDSEPPWRCLRSYVQHRRSSPSFIPRAARVGSNSKLILRGVNPVALAEQMANSPPPEQQGGRLFRGAGGGALFGTLIGGAAGGHWGEGAGIGALVGTMGMGMRMRREQQQAAMQQQGMQSQASSQLSVYNRAVGACMTGRGYTVE